MLVSWDSLCLWGQTVQVNVESFPDHYKFKVFNKCTCMGGGWGGSLNRPNNLTKTHRLSVEWRQTFIHKTVESVGERLSNESKDGLSLTAHLLLWCDFIWITKKQKGFSKLGSQCTNKKKDKAAQNNKKTTLKCKEVLFLYRAVIQRSTQTDATFDQSHPSVLMTESPILSVCCECVLHWVCVLACCANRGVDGGSSGTNCGRQTEKTNRPGEEQKERIRAEVNVSFIETHSYWQFISLDLAFDPRQMQQWAALLWDGNYTNHTHTHTGTQRNATSVIVFKCQAQAKAWLGFWKQNNNRPKLSPSYTHTHRYTHPNTTSVHSLSQGKEVESSWPGPSCPDRR